MFKSMFFSDMKFPEDIAYGATGGPQFDADLISSNSGYEHRNINWENAKIKYNVGYGIKTKSQLDKLIAFFRIHKGKAIGFRFKDWTDCQIIDQQIMCSSINNKTFQVTKLYQIEGNTCKRVILKPVGSTVMLQINGKKLEPYEFLVDSNSGVVKLRDDHTESDVLTVSCEFDVPMRFDTDFLSCTLESYNAKNINLLEIKL